MVGGTVQTRVVEGCYPQLHLNRTGDFAFGWSFKNLLGAIWLQMAWLLASGDGARRCKLPDCFRIVAFEPSQPPIEPGLKKNARGEVQDPCGQGVLFPRTCCQVQLPQEGGLAWLRLAGFLF
jgi:hypothetical protein